MSNRLDVILVDADGARIFHQPWGASALLDMLIAGPDRAWDAASDGFDQTMQLDDSVAALCIDRARRVLVIAGPAQTISAAGKLRPQAHEVLPELAVAWPGWRLTYEPDHVLEPVALYVHGLGIPLASLNEPHVIADYRKEPRFVTCTYQLDVPEAATPPAPAPTADRSRVLADIEDQLSIRAANELMNSGLVTVGDALDLEAAALARLGVTERTRRELSELFAVDDAI